MAEKRAGSNAQLVDKAIQAFEKNLGKKNVTVGEFVKLLEIQKEIDGDEPRDIKVTWVEPGENKPSEKLRTVRSPRKKRSTIQPPE